MKNFVQKGCAVTVSTPYDVLAGAGVKVGAIFGVAVNDALSGVDVVLEREGVFDLAKVSAQAWAVGDVIFWDNTAKVCTNVKGTANLRIGKAVAAADNPSATGRLVLCDDADITRVVAGQHTTVDEDDTVVTGLSKVVSVVASLDDDPGDGCMHATATIGDQAGAPTSGSIQIKTWKSTDADASLVAASTFGKKVNWIAFGY